MDTVLIYGLLTAATALGSGAAGARAANLSREAGPSEAPINHLVLSEADSGMSKVHNDTRGAIRERCAGAQNAAAWLATSTALLGVASTRPATDVVGILFVVIGGAFVVVAIQAVLRANDVSRLPTARSAFDVWYLPWLRDFISTGERPSDEQVANAFTETDPANASIMRRFSIWPFRIVQLEHAMPPSEYLDLTEDRARRFKQ